MSSLDTVECLDARVLRRRDSPRLEMGNDDRLTAGPCPAHRLAPALWRRLTSRIAFPLPILTHLIIASTVRLQAPKVGAKQRLRGAP